MDDKLEFECWAMKDIDRNKFVSSKFGRSLWIRKPHPNNSTFIGYRHFERGTSMLKPVRVRVTELDME